jgi:phage-related minor tail protein
VSVSRKDLLQITTHIPNIVDYRSKEVLRKMFAEGANAFIAELNSVSQSLAQISGDLETQLETVKRLATTLEPINAKIQQLEEVARTCEEAGIDDNE